MKYKTFREFVSYKEAAVPPTPQQMQKDAETEKELMNNPQVMKNPANPQQNKVIDQAIKAKRANPKVPLKTIVKGQSMIEQ